MRGSSPLTKPVDIRPDHLEIVQGILRGHLPVDVKVWVFGSRTNWTTKDSSDLDLALDGESKLSHKLLGALKDAFDDSALPYTVDVVDLNAVSHAFKQIVKEQRVALPLVRAPGRVDGAWREVTLGDVAELVMGQSPPGAKVSGDNGLALLNGPTEFGASHPTPVQFTTDARKHAQPGDILFCVRGSTTGRMNWADQEYAIGRGVAAIRHKNDSALQPFVRGVIELGLPELLAQATGSTFPNVSAQQLAEIPYPSLDEDEQRAIAHVLGALDDKIELNRRMNETLEEMARALFKSWFVDFDPVRAKMEGRWQRGESLPGLPAEHYDLFPDRLVDSDLGEIPEGWEVKTLGEVVELAYGKPLRADHRKGGSVPVYGSNGQVGRHDERLVAGPGIVVGRKGNPGVVTWAHGDLFPIDTAFYVLLRDSNVGLPFLFFALTGQDLPSVSADSAVPGLNRNLAYMNRQLVPEQLILDEFNDYVGTIFSRRHGLDEESRALAAQRDTLLPLLVSGEVGVGGMI